MVFVAAAESCSFSAAGRAVGLPASSISRRISSLEARLGTPLFVRTTRDITLTEAGLDFADRVRRILVDLREAELDASSFSREPRGTLKIETRPGLSAWLLAPMLHLFHETHPTVQVDLRLTNGLLDTLTPGTDLGIRYGVGPSSSMLTRKIIATRQATYAGGRYLRDAPPLRTPDDLVNHQCIAFFYGDAPTVWRYRNGVGYDREHVVAGPLRSNDVNALAVATVNEMGVNVTPEWVMRDQVRNGCVQQVLTDYEVTTMGSFDITVHAIYHPMMRDVRKVQVFLDFLVDHLRSTGNL